MSITKVGKQELSSNSGSEMSLDTSSNSIPKNAEKRQNKNTGT